jgi:hypothetical protein
MSQYHSKRTAKVVNETSKRKHLEADLHLSFCKWIKLQYPKLEFIRHEREKARGFMLQGLFKIYNSLSGVPDFELIKPVNGFSRLYIEFKKPEEKWLLRDDITVKKEYAHQYLCHLTLWDSGSCAYFCNDFEDAKRKLILYLDGNPEKKQEYLVSL